jgi:hypothetical protein
MLVVALLVYNDLFFAERFGLNVLLFFVLILVFQFLLYRESFRSRNVLISLGLTLFTAVMLVYHNSLLSKWMFFISYSVMLGFLLAPRLRTVFYALLNAVANFVRFPTDLFQWNRDGVVVQSRGRRVTRFLLLSLLPVAIGLIFLVIYRVANPVFAEVTDNAWNSFSRYIRDIFRNISLVRILFLAFGLFLISGILIHRGYTFFKQEEEGFSDGITRQRKSRGMYPYLRMGFKNEYISGIMLMVIMNAMLALLNGIDIRYIWISFNIPEGMSLSEMVHQGTEWLIVSIVLSIIVMIWIFRANQNFYSGSRWLKYLAYAWIIQNMVLTVSLMLRNNMYVSWHALAYKRLGVYVFITLTFIGLITMIWKIGKARSLFYLIRVNGWAAYGLMCGVCVVNWDTYIAKYNVEFNKATQLDTDFLLRLSPKAYPYIFDKLPSVKEKVKMHQQDGSVKVYYVDPDRFEAALIEASRHYVARNSENTWRSYNAADAYALDYIKKKIK